MTASPVISVLIPTYNRAQLLGRCLRSVFAAAGPNVEVLVADNCAMDETPDVLASFDDSRLRYWRHATNIGIERNFLSLVKEARGEWLFFLTDDDLLLPGGFEKLLAVARTHPDTGVILTDARVVDIDGNYLRMHRFYPDTRRFAAGNDALTVFVQAAHVVSRLFMRRRWIDVEGVEATTGSLYPQMYMVGSIVRDHPGYYLADSVIDHTTDNPTDWSYAPDFMVGTRIALIQHLLPGAKWRRERDALLDQVRDEIRTSHLPLSARSPGSFFRHQAALLRHRAVGLSPRYWRHLASFLVLGGWRAARRMLRS